MTLRALIFGVDGVLAESEEAHRLAFNEVFKEAGLDWHWDKALYAQLLTISSGRERIQQFIKSQQLSWRETGDTGGLITAMLRREATLFAEMAEKGDVGLRPSIKDVTAAAHQAGVRLAIATSATRSSVTTLVQSCLGAEALTNFDCIVSGDSVPASRANPNVYLRALDELGLPPAHCLAIEGSATGLIAAIAAGLPVVMTCGLYSGAATDQDLANACRVVPDLTGLAPGPRIVETPPQDVAARILAALRDLHTKRAEVIPRVNDTPLQSSSVLTWSDSMKISDILKAKGPAVITVRPDATIADLASRLRSERIGAAIVSHDGHALDGIISERDIAYGLALHGGKLGEVTVSALMTKTVITCSPADSVAEMMNLMSRRRIRHLPVKEGDELVGVISIGDVLKYRLDEMRLEANVLRDFAIARG